MGKVAIGPLLTSTVNDSLLAARRAGDTRVDCSLDLGRSTTQVLVGPTEWMFDGQPYPFFDACKPRTIYHWTAGRFEPVARFDHSLVKLVPTEWGVPTFEIDGIKMLVSAHISPWADAERKVRLIQPRGKIILDTCGGLGYFAACCLAEQCMHVHSYEKNRDVIWLRSLNPWSPDNLGSRAAAVAMTLVNGDITEHIGGRESSSIDALLHDPPRFGIAGELYSQALYDQFARVLKRKGKMFHYTGTPNQLSRGRDLPNEVATRLRHAGFAAELCLDGVLAVKR
jgi:hypothetical protein